MTTYQTTGTYAAVVKFSSSKVCFLNVPDFWLPETTEIVVFKLFYGNQKEAFVSCLPYKPTSSFKEPHILVNSKFADMIGLKEWEKVCLQQWNNTIPVVQEVRLEPLTPDDWEILELNAKSIEQNLMNQIRVVWPKLVFPVWVSNISITVRIVEVNPDSRPALLAEFTELHVVPVERSRHEAPSPLPAFHERKPVYHLQFQHLRTKKPRRDSPSVIIGEDSTKSPTDTTDSPARHHNPNMGTVARAFSLFSSFLQSTPDEQQKRQYLDSVYKDFMPMGIDLVLHALPYSRPNVRPLPLSVQSTTVFISASTYVALYGDTEVPPCFVAVLSKFPPRTDNHPSVVKESQASKDKKVKSPTGVEEERQPTFHSVCVVVMVMQSSEEDEFNVPIGLFTQGNAIVVSKELKRSLSLEVSCRVHLRGIKTKPSILSNVVLHSVSSLPRNITNDIIRSNFENWAFGVNGEESSLVLSDGTLINMRLFGQKQDFFISVNDSLNQTFNSSSSSLSNSSPNLSISEHNKQKSDPKYGFLDYANIRDLQVVLGPDMALTTTADCPYLQKPQNLYQEINSVHLDSLGGIKDIADKALECLEFWLKLRPLSYVACHPFTFSGCMLVCGPKGVGKSVFAKGLCKVLAKSPHHVFVQTIHCLPLKGKKIDTITKKWNEIVFDAVCYQPSIILFEDLDYVASAPVSHEQEVGPDAIYVSSVVETFIHMLRKITESKGKVTVIVTSQSTHTLHPTLVNTKGRHIFQKVIEIQPPNANQRKEILKSLVLSKSHINSKSVDKIDWKKIATKTEGYVALDLDSLVDRATHAAWVRMGNLPKTQDIILHLDDFEMALEGYVPSSLRGIPLQVHDHKTWADVGGLREVKKVIQQIIMWPIKYKQIFKSYSLKPQTNILLYGAPGTGKTLLAGVVANECGLNFISIKGPELLSKYIGASEQSIRDLFKRASTARPCVLFFDEFDSIAPRRGHDSTGVTDRVVNQLLTQLDGVESLEGVHVIAASSRPELIDPALLRPGRLDKCLLCPLPDEEERFEILKCLSSKLPVSPEIDFKYIASRTEHFSGADLQALLYSANIEALHEVQAQSSRRYSSSSEDLNYPSASDKLMYMPSIEDGLKVPSYEEGKRIVQEVEVIKDNFSGILEKRRSRHRSRLNVVVNQNHLLKVLLDMKPSVSEMERMRYEAVFKNLQNTLKGEATVPSAGDMKRVTLA